MKHRITVIAMCYADRISTCDYQYNADILAWLDNDRNYFS